MKSLEIKSRSEIIEEAMRRAVGEAVETHRRMGRSIVVSENGQVKRIKPQDISPCSLPHDALEQD